MGGVRPLICFILIFILLFSCLPLFSYGQTIFAIQSPSFVRQEVIDSPSDWILWKPSSSNASTIRTHEGRLIEIKNAKNISQCETGVKNNEFVSPDIQSVSYISNGTTLNATVWLTSSLANPSQNDTLDPYQEKLSIRASNLPTSSNITLQKYAAIKLAELYNPLNNFTVDENMSRSTIAGSGAYKLVYGAKSANGLELKNMTLWTIKNDKAYEITYSALQANYDDYLPRIKTMLDSIKFQYPIGKLASNNNSNITNSNSGSLERRVQFNKNDNNNLLEYKGLGIQILYPSDWQKKVEKQLSPGRNAAEGNGIISFISPFTDAASKQPSWHEMTFTMGLALDSAQHGGVTDYRVMLSRDPIISKNNHYRSSGNTNNETWAWTRREYEVSAFDKTRILSEEKNFTGFYDKTQGQPPYNYILFSFDLSKVNLPQQYRSVFYITDLYVKQHALCRLVDTTNWDIIPPPEFTMTTNPNPVELRPGEERDIQLLIKGNTHLPTEALISQYGENSKNNKNNNNTWNIQSGGLNTSIALNRISIPDSGTGTLNLHVKALNNAEPISHVLPIMADISFPTTITNRGGESFTNSKSETQKVTSNLTLVVLPAYTTEERFGSFVNSWITPVTGVWTFLAGVAAVLTPLIIRVYNKRKGKSTNKNNADSNSKGM